MESENRHRSIPVMKQKRASTTIRLPHVFDDDRVLQEFQEQSPVCGRYGKPFPLSLRVCYIEPFEESGILQELAMPSMRNLG